MVGMISPNGQMSVSGFQGNVGFGSNCYRISLSSPPGFSLHRRPSFGGELKVQKRTVKRGTTFRALCAGQSVSGGIVDKEFDFKPSFGEYLNVMESVKTMRDKKQEVDGNEKEAKLSGRSWEKEKKPRVVKEDRSFKSRDGFRIQESKGKKVVEMKGRFDGRERRMIGNGKWNLGKDGEDRKWPKRQARVEKEEDYDYSKKIIRENGHETRSSEMCVKRRWDNHSKGEVANRDRTEIRDTDRYRKEMGMENGYKSRSSDGFEKRQWDNQSMGEVANRDRTDIRDIHHYSREMVRENGYKLRSSDRFEKRQWDNRSMGEIANRERNVVEDTDCYNKEMRRESGYKDRSSDRFGTRRWDNQSMGEVANREKTEVGDTDFYRNETRRENGYKARPSGMFVKRSWDYRSTGEVANRDRTDIGINKFLDRSRDQDSSVIGNGDIVTKQGRLNRREEDEDSNVERAAFRNLGDEVNDLMDGRRRPRVEMDERIQKLAKSLNGADVDMPEWMFSKTMRSARIIFTDHSISRLIQILGKYDNWRRVLQVIEWLQIRERFKSHKLRYVYTTALNVLGKSRRPVEALNVFNEMRQQFSSYPDLVAYHCIAITLGQAGHMMELFDVIEIMRSPPNKNFKTGPLENWDPRLEPDIIVYNAVLNACVQRNQWEGAFWVLQQLKDKGLNPPVTTYGLVMEVMFACGKYNLVHEFFKKVQKSSIPNALTYRVLVNTLWKEGKLDEAVKTVKDMEKRGIVGSAALYYDFARCLCSAGRSQDALKQVEKICKVANKPLVVTYTGLIQACIESGNIKDGGYMFNHMMDFCAPNLVTCNIMLKGYLNNGMFEEGKELFQEMLENLSRNKSRNDHKVLVAPDIYTFNTILETCVAEKRWADFEYAYKKMLHHGFHFNSKRHLQMILEASRSGKGELLDMTWNHLAKFDRSPPMSLVKERFCAKLEKEDYACAMSTVCNENLVGSPEFSVKAWSKLLDQNHHRFPKGALVRLVHEVSNIIGTTEKQNPVLGNLLASCKEISRTSLLGNVELAEPLSRLSQH